MPPSIQPFQVYFSGAPTVYPPLGALADTYGGLAGARLLSLLFMLGATCLLYATAVTLFDRATAVAAAATFVLLAPSQLLSAFATYDPMALFLLALSSWLVVRARGWASEPLLLAALVMALGDATKYAAGLWNPVVLALAGITIQSGGPLRALLRVSRLAVYMVLPLVAALMRLGGSSYVHGIMFTTLDRQAGGATSSPVMVLGDSLAWIWPVLAFALVGVGVSFTESIRTRLLCITFTVGMLLAPIHQAQIHTIVSLPKHVDFGAWFGAIAAGYILARAARLCQAKGWRVVAAAASVIAFIGVVQANVLFSGGWPNMSIALTDMSKLLPATPCPCLVTANNVVEYYFMGRFSPNEYGKLAGPFFFSYTDPRSKQTTTGLAAYDQAIHNHYFSIVEIDPAENPSLFKSSAAVLYATPGYHLIDRIAILHWPRKVIEIWRYEPRRTKRKRHHGHHG